MQCTAASVTRVKDGWKYGLHIDAVNDEDRDNYIQIVYDRHHSMSNIMQPSVSTFSDLSVNIRKRIQPLKKSRRKLPRVEIGREFITDSGDAIRVEDMNAAYIRVADKDLKKLPRQFALDFDGYVLEVNKSDIRYNLYEIANREELLNAPGFTGKLLGTGESVPV